MSKRLENSKKGALTALIANIVKIVLGFLNQRVFIIVLGTVILGLNSLFSNIISMLGIIELGIGSAIVYNMYGPIARKEYDKVIQLANFYKKAYRVISVCILCIGLIIMPFLKIMVDRVVNGMYLYYILFLIDVLLSYLVAYKVSILSAHQNNYIVNTVYTIYLVTVNVTQIIILLLTESFAAYLIVKLSSRILQNVLIEIEYNKKFSYIKGREVADLDKTTKQDITKKVKALFLHKISSFLVSNTDNLLISKIFGLAMVGLYSSYQMVFSAVQTLFLQMFNSIISSIGNLLVEDDSKKSYEIYKRINLLNFFIAAFCTVSLLLLLDPFVNIWLGEKYLLSDTTVLVLALVFYSNCMRDAPMSFKTAAGVFVEDKYVPLIESFINLVVSVLFAFWMGLSGVFIGTFVSSLTLHLYSYPQFVYGKIFRQKPSKYIVNYMKYFGICIIDIGISSGMATLLYVDNSFYRLIINGLICILIPNIINIAFFWKTDEFRYLLKIFGIRL